MEYTWSSLLWDIAAIWSLVACGLIVAGLWQGWRWIAQVRRGIASLGDDYTVVVAGPFGPSAEGFREVRLRFWHNPAVWFVLPSTSFAMFFLFALLSMPLSTFRVESVQELLVAFLLFGGMAGFCYLMYRGAENFLYRATNEGVLLRYGLVFTHMVPWQKIVEARIHGVPPLAVTIVAELPNGKRIERWLLNGFKDSSKFEPLIGHLLGDPTRTPREEPTIDKDA